MHPYSALFEQDALHNYDIAMGCSLPLSDSDKTTSIIDGRRLND